MKVQDRVYRKDPNMVSRRIADQCILVPIRQKAQDLESLFTLNEVASRIWELIDGKRSVSQIRDKIVEEFEVSLSDAENDLTELLLQLEKIAGIQEVKMDCPHVPLFPYHEFSKDLYEKALSESIPLSGSLELTQRCNLKCAHCYGAYDHKKEEMSYKETCRILDEIAEAGCLWLLMTGGEPLFRPDFLDIYTNAKKKGFLITLFTNGTLITPEIADELKKQRPFNVEISLYGITRETYEKVTGLQGSFESCMRGINLLLERKIPLSLKMLVSTQNLHELEGVRAYAQKLGLQFRFDPFINARLDSSRVPCEFRIPEEEVVRLDVTDPRRLKEWKQLCETSLHPPKTDDLYYCSAGKIGFHIDPYGQLSLCLMSRDPSYDLRKDSFKKAWAGLISQVAAQVPQGDYPCSRCDLVLLCEQCPAVADLETGDPQIPIEYFCRIAHMRAEAFGVERQDRKQKETITIT